MKVMVVGPQHSCTRLFVALLDVHPEVEGIMHLSMPSSGKMHSIREYFVGCDRMLIVSRDRCAVNLSNLRDYKIPLDDDIAGAACAAIRDELGAMMRRDQGLWRVSFASFDALINYRDVYLRHVLAGLGLEPSQYPTLASLEGQTRTPKDSLGRPLWFSVELTLHDANEKYYAPQGRSS